MVTEGISPITRKTQTAFINLWNKAGLRCDRFKRIGLKNQVHRKGS